ncbi:soluble quino protein glucose dehydrogenase [Cucurbitaria berberidis CBS 394.84]|uniref:Soluble quino protein glucose dehydrogenase n=1 Tax=Cucurbitaria berberidis CBS 394.84 TaxID=1168544 RepID=A0A9P4G852_9PLEO|nr:soluble quino protein glucose dehydrogenase [Cucurbitaria berberidis CBS 394.84]KAF1840796.1 soluble quino protein glucose dehydrogenase [Cucurbitaria berberidis CBS 394.84]
MLIMALKHLLALTFAVLTAKAQTPAAACQSPIAPQHGAPSVYPGFRVEVVANGLRSPRGILFDSEGGLLVVEQGHGISRLRLTGDGPCVRVDGAVQSVVADSSLSHGIALTQDGRTLYGSSHSDVFAWDYNASQGRTTSNSRHIIQDMGPDEGHTTRTLLLSKKVPDLLLVSRGSQSNLDLDALDVTTGVSTIKAFNVNNVTNSAYKYPSDGLLLGWGLRNSVGVAEDPISGGIYSVENSVDNIQRSGVTFNQNNPGEEMNFHGYLNGTRSAGQGGNHGYPSCFAAWNVAEVPNFRGTTGSQFAIGDQNATVNDDFCQNDRIAPRITFAAHMAPLDITFNPKGTSAWVTMHGSWNRQSPIGYKLSLVSFDGNGSPTSPANSTTAAVDIVSNRDLSQCPRGCFRPVGLAWDSRGRLFMSSDSTGEIYVVTKLDGTGVADVHERPSNGNSNPSGSGSAPSPTGSGTSKAVRRWRVASGGYWVAGAAAVGVLPMI